MAETLVRPGPSVSSASAPPGLTPSLLLAKLMRRRAIAPDGASFTSGKWEVSILCGDQVWTLRHASGEFSSSRSSKRGSDVWSIVEPLESPSRFIRTAVGDKEARKALPFLIEPQLPLPLEECAIAGMRLGLRAEENEYLVSYARLDAIQVPDGASALAPGGIIPASLPHLLHLIRPDCPMQAWNGLWLVSFPKSWTVVLVMEGRVLGVRSMPRGDIARLYMARQELGPFLMCRSLGPSNQPDWSELDGPDWCQRGSEWLGLTALTIRMGGNELDLLPKTLSRSLDRPASRRLLWGVSCFLFASSLAVWLGTHTLLDERFVEMAVQAEQIPAEVERLQREIAESTSPFSPEPPLPRCHQVLTWLSQVPGLCQDAGLSIEKFRYQMTQYPTAGREKESYHGKVSLDINCRDAFRARKILEAVSQQDPISPVDPKQPLEWSHHQGLYRLSFALKRPGRS